MGTRFTSLVITIATAWVLAGCGTARKVEATGGQGGIPAMAKMAGIQVGYSSMAELEAQMGPGKVEVGGHPNGARLWQVRGTSWVVFADAFDYSERGAVVDQLNIAIDGASEGRGERAAIPYARLDGKNLSWLGTIRPGMREDEMLSALRAMNLTVKSSAGGWEISAEGYSPLTSTPPNPFRQWTTRLSVTNGVVQGVALDARQ